MTREGKGKMLNFNWLVVAVSLALGSYTFAAPNPPAGASEESSQSPIVQELQTEVPAAPSGGQITGMLELRPSYTTQVGEAHTENLVELGYRFNPNFRAAYQLQLNTNLSNPVIQGQGLNPQPQASIFRFTFSNLWKSGDWSLSYEPRFYIPTNATDANSKRYLSMRNYVMLGKRVTDNYSITFIEIPILHWYGARGVGAVPNKYFENRFYIMNDFTFGNLTVSFPILWNMPRMLEYAGKPSTVQHNIWIWPEVSYAVDPNVSVGAALYTSSLVAPDLSDTSFTGEGAGFSQSVLQFLFRATL